MAATESDNSQPKPLFPVGGVLQRFSHNWTVLLSLPLAIREVILHGYALPLSSPPPRSAPRTFPSRIDRRQVLLEQVTLLLGKGVIEQVNHPAEDGFYSRLFVVPKSSGGWRPVIDLSLLNQHLRVPRFKMETIESIAPALQDSHWAVSIDLSDAYFHVPIHPSARPLLRFVCDGTVFQFRALPFGLATAPFVFTWILRPFVRRLREQGIQIHVYLDDWLIHHADRATLIRHRDIVIRLASSLGFRINWEKSSLTPVQSLQYLGVILDFKHQVLLPTPQKCQEVASRVSKILRHPWRPAEEWNTLLGKLTFLIKAIPEGQLHCRPLQMHMREHWTFDWVKDALLPIPLTPDMIKPLKWWLAQQNLLKGRPFSPPPSPTLKLFTDASTEGWGAHLSGSVTSGIWAPHERDLHINLLEMMAIFKAVVCFQELVRDNTILIATDNSTVLSYLRRQGGTKSPSLLQLTYQFFALAEKLNLSFLCRHVPGRKNVLADALSRRNQVIHTEWTLSSQVLNTLWERWPRPQVDAFATCLNHRLPQYFSPVVDPKALGVDGLSQNWQNRSLYMFPPDPLLPLVIRKLLKDPHGEVFLVFPLNTLAPWYPKLLTLTERPGAELLRLPPRDDLVSQPLSGALMPNVRSRNFHVLRLSKSAGKSEVAKIRSSTSS